MKTNMSTLERLLSTMSWEGKLVVKAYRNGGKGMENVLTTEAFNILEFLPRKTFWTPIVNALHMENDSTRRTFLKELDSLTFSILPDNYYLKEPVTSHARSMPVQPDGILETDSLYILLEVKPIKPGPFQRYQMTKEYYLVVREAKRLGKTPLLLFVTGKEPPYTVKQYGKANPVPFIQESISHIYSQTKSNTLTLDELINQVEDVVTWVTWNEINQAVKLAGDTYENVDQDTYSAVSRLYEEFQAIIKRHTK